MYIYYNFLGQMYPAEFEIKDTTDSITSASYLDLLLSIGRYGKLHTSIYDKRGNFNFHITNLSFPSSNIPFSPAHDVFISQLIRYARACSSYNVLFWGKATFQKAHQTGIPRGTLEIVNRHSGSFMVDTEILLSNMKSPSHEC